MGSVSAKSIDETSDYKVDPLLGFDNGRKPREMTVTQAEFESAKVPLELRDYCAAPLMKLLECRADNYPWVYKCHHQKHDYLTCQFDDYVIRMKEFERERRLRERGALAAAAEEADE